MPKAADIEKNKEKGKPSCCRLVNDADFELNQGKPDACAFVHDPTAKKYSVGFNQKKLIS